MVTDIVDLRVPRPGLVIFDGGEDRTGGVLVGSRLPEGTDGEAKTTLGLVPARPVTVDLTVVERRDTDCPKAGLSMGLVGEVDLALLLGGSGFFSPFRLLSIGVPGSPLVELAAELTETLGL